jgi:hypothetical protein
MGRPYLYLGRTRRVTWLPSEYLVWDIYDIVAPLVSKTLVANAHNVRQIAEARVKTDTEDIKRLLTLLFGNIVPEVWVPPMHVRELHAHLLSLASLQADHNTCTCAASTGVSKNRLHSVIQRFNLTPPPGKILADKNMPWWQQHDFPDPPRFSSSA